VTSLTESDVEEGSCRLDAAALADPCAESLDSLHVNGTGVTGAENDSHCLSPIVDATHPKEVDELVNDFFHVMGTTR
jgi:hypothetical protein